MDLAAVLGGLAAAVWVGIALLPWQPHRTRERIAAGDTPEDLSDVTVIVPARNEAPGIGQCLTALSQQGAGLHVVVVDDQSEDATALVAADFAARYRNREAISVEIVDGAPLPSGWGGKLWALQQGLERVSRSYCVLLDADIVLAPHMIPALLAAARHEQAALVSVMAKLSCETFWEKLLVPPFIFFFKLLYPFALAARRSSRVAAAAGGCIFVETAVLRAVGGFSAWPDALIDDCTLARHIKSAGFDLRLYMSDDVTSLRRYAHLAEFWQMVARTAYTQLAYSLTLLLATTVVMGIVFFGPFVALVFSRDSVGVALGSIALLAMLADFAPVSRFYGLGTLWLATLPLAALLFLAMTWHSAINYLFGIRATWKSRRYDSHS